MRAETRRQKVSYPTLARSVHIGWLKFFTSLDRSINNYENSPSILELQINFSKNAEFVNNED